MRGDDDERMCRIAMLLIVVAALSACEDEGALSTCEEVGCPDDPSALPDIWARCEADVCFCRVEEDVVLACVR